MKIPIFRMAELCLLSIGIASAETAVPTPRIIDQTSDGAPVVVQIPKPGLVVPAKDVVSSISVNQGGREITIQKIKPMALPEPIASSPPDQDTPAIQSRIAQIRANRPSPEICSFGATVYRSELAGTRSLFTYYSGHGDQSMVSFWSSMDASLLQGISQYEGADGIIRCFMMIWSVSDTDAISARSARHGTAYQPPAIPDFPAGPASFTILTGNPTPEALATIQSLHDVYNQSKTHLLSAAVTRENVRLAQEAELRANPPKPQNIVLNYWDISKSAPAEGGEK